MTIPLPKPRATAFNFGGTDHEIPENNTVEYETVHFNISCNYIFSCNMSRAYSVYNVSKLSPQTFNYDDRLHFPIESF